ncbi:MAG: OmpA family protein [Bacteroidales bacterium]|nr:OmpA family protein [Bacteroidales bacterium]
MKRLVMMVLVLVAIGGTTEVSAQSWLDQLGKKVKEKAKDKVEQKILQKTDQVIEKAFDKTEEAVKGNGGNQTGVPQEAAPQQPVQQAPAVQDVPAEVAPEPQSLEMTYAKSDFVAGDEIFFEDNQANEQLGEFPSQWDVDYGNAEIVQMGGDKVIMTQGYTAIMPLIGDGKNYFPESFTVEFDIYPQHCYSVETATDQFEIGFNDSRTLVARFHTYRDEGCFLYTNWRKPNDDGGSSDSSDNNVYFSNNEWHHIAISFNKRACKIYVDGFRVLNIPNMKQPTSMWIWSNEKQAYFKNFRIAKGAVPLYDRMMSDGKFITYGITFDVGKATIKPESMGEINRIVQLMTENPDLKFSVEGHTDNTGKEASNQTLSEQRSQAIVDKLVELGIAKDRLTAVGKGQNSPIADNNTDEGRAKNRRVEFVKI